MKPRLLFVSNLFPDAANPVRGLDNATLLHALAERVEVRVVALRPVLGTAAIGARGAWLPRPGDESLRPTYLGVPYVPKVGGLFNHHLARVRLARALTREFREGKPDAVLGSWLFPDGVALAGVGSRLGFAPVLVAQGSDVHQYLRMPARRRAILGALPRVHAVITRSRDLASLLVAAGADPAKVCCIYNGVETARFRPRPQGEARQALGIPASSRIVLCVGNLLPVKNPELLVQAVSRIEVGALPQIVFVGTGPLADSVRRLGAERGVELTLAGRLDPDAIARWMNAADLLCIPSRNEGVPNVLLEAMASGLPVVSTAVGGIPEIIRPGETGLLVASGDETALAEALGMALVTPWDRDRIRAEGLRFDWHATADHYAKLLGLA